MTSYIVLLCSSGGGVMQVAVVIVELFVVRLEQIATRLWTRVDR